MAGYLGGMIQQTRGEGDGMTGEDQRTEGMEFRDDSMEREHVGRDAPSSQVGYGGGNRTAEYAHNPPAEEPQSVVERNDSLGEGKAHGGRFVGVHGTSDPRLSMASPGDLGLPDYGGTTGSASEQDRSEYSLTNRNVASPATGSESGNYGMTDANATDQMQDLHLEGRAERSSEYGTTDTDAKPSEAGYGRSGPGGYTGEGGAQRSRNYGVTDANAKPSVSGDGTSAPGGYTGDGGSKVSREEHEKSKYGTCGGNSFPREAGTGLSSPGGYAGEGGAQRYVPEGARTDHPYGSSMPSAKPSDEGFGTSTPGGYAGEGGSDVGHETAVPVTHKSQHFQDSSNAYGGLPAPMRPPGAVLLDEQHFDGPKRETTSTGGYVAQPTNLDSGSLQESEVRAGVPHGIVSGHVSGAGQDNYGASEVHVPMSGQIGHQGVKPQEYHQTGSLPGHSGSAYSQEYTQPDGPNTHASEVEGVNQPSTKPSPIETTNLMPAATEDTHKEEGFMAKIKSHLPGHKHHAHTDVVNKHAVPTAPATEHEKPSFMEKMKDKLSSGHHKQASEQ